MLFFYIFCTFCIVDTYIHTCQFLSSSPSSETTGATTTPTPTCCGCITCAPSCSPWSTAPQEGRRPRTSAGRSATSPRASFSTARPRRHCGTALSSDDLPAPLVSSLSVRPSVRHYPSTPPPCVSAAIDPRSDPAGVIRSRRVQS